MKIITHAEVVAASVPVERPIRGIYFLLERGEVVYIGQSVNCRARIEQHLNGKAFDSYAMFECGPDVSLDEAEAVHIADYLPRLNTHMPQNSGLVSATYLSREKIAGKVIIRRWVQQGLVTPLYMGDGVFYRWSEINAALEGAQK